MTDPSANEPEKRAQQIVGQRVRVLREQRGLSLRGLAERCGLSSNAISKIERGENSPTVASLHLLATALNVPITAFFQEGSAQSVVVVKRGQRSGGIHSEPMLESLGNGLRNQQLEPFLLTISAQAGGDARPITHVGQEFVYCLQGEAHYEIAGERYLLEPGDSLLFEADQPHRCLNLTDTPAVILLVFQSREAAQVTNHAHTEL
ncbi:MAG: cupin domain-containing protein [Anaerolineae bacterium]